MLMERIEFCGDYILECDSVCRCVVRMFREVVMEEIFVNLRWLFYCFVVFLNWFVWFGDYDVKKILGSMILVL